MRASMSCCKFKFIYVSVQFIQCISVEFIYDEILLMGFNENDIFGRTTDVRELKYLDCEDNQGSDYAVYRT